MPMAGPSTSAPGRLARTTRHASIPSGAAEADFGSRTQALWDDAEGRFRDWDARTSTFLAPSAETNYWGVDPCRYSALAFTPLLASIATPAQAQRLHDELRHYAGPPWT